MTKQQELVKAEELARKYHAGQKDKGGKDYIHHPEIIASMVHTIDMKIVAWMHDLIEDTPVTLEYLREQGFSESTIHSIDLLTHRKGCPYKDYIEGLSRDSIACAVKLADLSHNMDASRIKEPSADYYRRLKKYGEAYYYLQHGTWPKESTSISASVAYNL